MNKKTYLLLVWSLGMATCNYNFGAAAAVDDAERSYDMVNTKDDLADTSTSTLNPIDCLSTAMRYFTKKYDPATQALMAGRGDANHYETKRTKAIHDAVNKQLTERVLPTRHSVNKSVERNIIAMNDFLIFYTEITEAIQKYTVDSGTPEDHAYALELIRGSRQSIALNREYIGLMYLKVALRARNTLRKTMLQRVTGDLKKNKFLEMSADDQSEEDAT